MTSPRAHCSSTDQTTSFNDIAARTLEQRLEHRDARITTLETEQ
ncbi:MAG: hypothetical protein ACRDS9_03415 [Pseudonocardiaceae bacterium]